jgi:NitT/TauT family transport system permease protein
MLADGIPPSRLREVPRRRLARFRFPAVFAASPGFRQLPVQRPWKQYQIVLAQALVVVAAIGGWQVAAWLKLIDPFFWSQPTAIANTLTIFFVRGDALTDIAYTFQSTICGFVLGTAA